MIPDPWFPKPGVWYEPPPGVPEAAYSADPEVHRRAAAAYPRLNAKRGKGGRDALSASADWHRRLARWIVTRHAAISFLFWCRRKPDLFRRLVMSCRRQRLVGCPEFCVPATELDVVAAKQARLPKATPDYPFDEILHAKTTRGLAVADLQLEAFCRPMAVPVRLLALHGPLLGRRTVAVHRDHWLLLGQRLPEATPRLVTKDDGYVVFVDPVSGFAHGFATLLPAVKDWTPADALAFAGPPTPARPNRQAHLRRKS